MDKQNALRLNALLAIALDETDANAVAGAQKLVTIRSAKSLVEDHLLSLGWTNSPDDLPEMVAAKEWAEEQIR